MKTDKLKFKNENSKTYIIYTILFCIISFGVFITFIKMNKSFIWISDGFLQHYVFLYDFNETIRNIFQNGFSMLSWNMGLGLDIIGQYSYYVMGDPFAYISLLFPMEYLETIYSVLIILRIYCVGLAFIAYCNYHKKERVNTLVGAIIYTFCGFVLFAAIRHPYFTNAVILLPLNFIGIDKLLKENKKAFFTFIVFISAISNYYFFYMITIVTLIYAIVKYIFEYNQGIKMFAKKALSAIGCYLIGVLMAGVILLPTVYAFLNSARTGYESTYAYNSGFYRVFFIGIISMKQYNWTAISMSSIVLLMVPILFTKLKEKESKTFATLFIITTVMLLIPLIASIMNGFSFPNNRWIFAYAFILAYIVTMCFNKNLKYSKKQIGIMSLVLLLYCIIGISITKFKIKSYLDFYGAISIAIVLLIIIILNNINKLQTIFVKTQKYMKIVAILLIICNIWGVSLVLYSKYGQGYAKGFLNNNSVMKRYSTLNGNINNFEQAIEYIKENDKGFYRIAKCDIPLLNISLIYNYHSIQTYVSIGNESIYNFSHGLEDNSYTETRCINGMDRRTRATTLLGTKYYICSKEDVQYIPYGYELFKEIEDTKIYINKNYISVGNVYDSYMLKEEYDKLSPLEKEDALLLTAVVEQNVSGIEKEDSIQDKIEDVIEVNYKEKSGIIKNNQIEVKKKNQSISLELDEVIPNTELYLSIKNLEYDSGSEKTNFKITASYNGIVNSEEIQDRLTSAYYVKNPNFLMNLGITKEKASNKLKITFNNKGTYKFDELQILAVPMEGYEEKIEELKENEMTNIVYGNDFISGHVSSDTKGILQITTSYSDGWKAFVDGKETDVIKVNEGFIGIVVEEGEHEVKFEYTTPYIGLGVICSIIGAISFIGILFFERRKS